MLDTIVEFISTLLGASGGLFDGLSSDLLGSYHSS